MDSLSDAVQDLLQVKQFGAEGRLLGVVLTEVDIRTRLSKDIVQFVEDSYAPIMTRGRGMSYTQNLYTLGNMYQVAFLKTHNPQYLARARASYEQGLTLAPRRPQFLYGLLDVYRLQGDADGVRSISQSILALWDDPRVKKSVDDFFAAYAAAQHSSTTPTGSSKTK